MKSKLLITLTALVAASSAQAALIAGWDFSQYTSDSFRSIDDSVTVDVLSANYSSLAPIGPASAPFGTMFIDGQFGSTNDSAAALIIPTAATIATSNLAAGGSFENFAQLAANGQAVTNTFSILNNAAANVVFRADVSSQASNYDTWVFSFGAVTAVSGSTANLTLSYSTNGTAYTALPTQAITNTDTAFTVSLPAISSDLLFIQVGFDNVVASNAVGFDNVAISATAVAIPEPSSYAAIAGAALLGFAALRRRRRA